MVTVAVVGCGPRGLTVLERFVHRLASDPSAPATTLYLIEPGPLGVGVHDRTQPDYLLLNTVAAELTAFVDPDMIPGGGICGPALAEWARRRGVPVDFDTHLPRRMLGEYLNWAANGFLDRAPDRLDVRHVQASAVDVQRSRRGREVVELDSGEHIIADHVVLCTGHTGAPAADAPDPAGSHRWIPEVYPLPSAVSAVPARATVGLLGTGLSAMDVIAALTVGRGGRFTGDGYVRSGQEPRIMLANRSGLPPLARPRPHTRPTANRAAWFTPDAVSRLRRSAADGRLNFRRDVLPLIEKEMWHRFELAGGKDQPAALREAVDELRAPTPPSDALADADTYQGWCTDRLRADLAEAEAGLDGSARKFALEVLRSCRDGLRAAVDPPGLTDPRAFFGDVAAAVNRTVIGPQAERIAELLALHEAGVLRFGPGPAPDVTWTPAGWRLVATSLAASAACDADWLVAAQTPQPRAAGSRNQVLRNLHQRGRLAEAELGLRLSGNHPVSASGRVEPALSVLGPLAEGSSYYNHYVPSPGTPSRAVADADAVVHGILAAATGTLARAA